MATALIYLVVVIVVAALVFLLAAVVFGRGEELGPLPPGTTPTRLPSDGLSSSDVRGLRFQQVVRGYKASEVDWALERVAGELDELHGRIGTLERQLAAAEEELRKHHHRSDEGQDSESGNPTD